MIWHLFANVAFEKWDWRNSVLKGIGGSETSQVEMARGLAARGHEVHSYAPLPDDCPREWEGTHWHDNSEVDFSQPGIWVLYRCPEKLDEFDPTRTDQVRWLMFQDWDYPTLTPERVKKLHRAVVLCRDHEKYLHRRCPELRHLTWVTRNAIKPQLIAEVEAAGVPPRNPKRIMYASSPDRGLKSALQIFQRAKEFVPDLELHCTYGYDNLNKMIDRGGPGMEGYRRERGECLKLVEETGAKFHGRLSQNQLYYEWLKTGMTVYCTTFFETGWITGLEAQALGAIPIFSPIHAQGENTKWGVAIIGHPAEEATIARFAAEVVRLATDPGLQERLRVPMMADVRAKWGWEQFVWQKPNENWEQAAEEDLAKLAAARNPPAGDPDTLTVEMFPNLCDNLDEATSRARWLRLRPGDVMLDIGAADGSWAIAAATQGAKVYAFEPNPNTFLDVAPRQYRVEDKIEAVRLTVTDGTANTPGTTWIDAFALDRGLARIDFVKIDVEGAELNVLHGMRAVLKKFRPRLMIEVHTETVENVRVTVADVQAALAWCDAGYECEWVELAGKEGQKYYHLYAEAKAPA